MSEQLPYDHELSDSERGITKLGMEFEQGGDYYFRMYVALRQYINDELDFTADESAEFILSLEKTGRLPTIDQYRDNPEGSLEMHRLAMLTTWMPLYRLSHTSHEFDTWLPHALAIILPANSRHSLSACIYPERADELVHEQCYVSGCCPARTVVRHVVNSAARLPMDTLSYELDPMKTYYTTHMLIDGVYEHKMLRDYERSMLHAVYQRRFSESFGLPDDAV